MTPKTLLYGLVLILGALTAIGPFSIDMYLPGFPAIAKSLHTTTAQVSLSLVRIFYRDLLRTVIIRSLCSTAYGRKKPLYVGVWLFTSWPRQGCYFVTTIEMLIGLRFIQAVGSCAAAVGSMAMVRDIFPVKDNAKSFRAADIDPGCIANDSTNRRRIRNRGFWLAIHIYHISRYCCHSINNCYLLFTGKLPARPHHTL